MQGNLVGEPLSGKQVLGSLLVATTWVLLPEVPIGSFELSGKVGGGFLRLCPLLGARPRQTGRFVGGVLPPGVSPEFLWDLYSVSTLIQSQRQVTYWQTLVATACAIRAFAVLVLTIALGLRPSFRAASAYRWRLRGGRKGSGHRRAADKPCQCLRGIGNSLQCPGDSNVDGHVHRSAVVYLLL